MAKQVDRERWFDSTSTIQHKSARLFKKRKGEITMARERMVTRTVSTTTVDVLVINIETAEVYTKSFVLGQNMVKDEKTMLNNAQKMLDDETSTNLCKCVAIKNIKEEETLYGMTEQDFLKYAKVLPPR